MLKKGKKLLFLCSFSAPYGGNFIPSLMSLEERLNACGVDCIYAFPKEAKVRNWFSLLEQEEKQLLTLDFQLSRKLFIKSLEEIVQKNQICYVYTHFCSVLPIEIFAALHRDVHVFTHIHSDFSEGKKSVKQSFKNFLLYKAFSGRVTFFSVSPTFVNYNPPKISFVPNGLAKNRLECMHTGGQAIREQYSVTADETLCEIYGWSPAVKGVDVAANAVKNLNEKIGSPVKLAIVCGDNMTPDKMRRWISENTECSGEENYFIYWKPREDVFSYHEAADILLSASRSEGFSYAILEMLSLGKQCVVSDIPGVAWSKKYETVTSFQSENYQDCSAALRRAIHNGKEAGKDVSAAVQDDYSIDKWTEAIVEKMNQAT